MIDTKYFREYRESLGFTMQNGVKVFFAAKDIIPTVNYNYINLLNERLIAIISKINNVVVGDVKVNDLDSFCDENIKKVFEKLKNHNIIPRLNNQGRRPEEVYFSWMRGFVISSYFLNALSLIFDVDIKNIDLIGDDDLVKIESFKRTPKADLQINLKNGENISSLVIHFDLFNGQVAFVKTDDIDDTNVNWITRQQMEGQTVFNIDQNYFVWKLIEKPPKYADLSLFIR